MQWLQGSSGTVVPEIGILSPNICCFQGPFRIISIGCVGPTPIADPVMLIQPSNGLRPLLAWKKRSFKTRTHRPRPKKYICLYRVSKAYNGLVQQLDKVAASRDLSLFVMRHLDKTKVS